MIDWLTGTLSGKIIATFFMSMLPVGELRVGLPYGMALGLDLPVAMVTAILGNMVPVPFIIIYISRVFKWMRRHMPMLDSFITKLENKANVKGETVEKYGPIGLLAFVAIPLPGTGAWTGALVAALLNMKVRKAAPFIFIGVCSAAIIVALITLGVIHVVF